MRPTPEEIATLRRSVHELTAIDRTRKVRRPESPAAMETRRLGDHVVMLPAQASSRFDEVRRFFCRQRETRTRKGSQEIL